MGQCEGNNMKTVILFKNKDRLINAFPVGEGLKRTFRNYNDGPKRLWYRVFMCLINEDMW
jgi:hypothetical protein